MNLTTDEAKYGEFQKFCFNNRVMLLKLMRSAECGKREVQKTISVEHEE